MKKLLSSSIIAMLASLPAFATTPTTLPNNALCNETNLGTESGSADIEVVWEPNTINTQWFTGYGENTAAANATTCEYGGTINLPATNPSRAGYAFAGWKLRAPQCAIPAALLNTNGNHYYAHGLDNGENYCFMESFEIGEEINCSTVSDLSLNQWKTEFSYGTVRGIASCQPTVPSDIAYFSANIASVIGGEMDQSTFLSEYTALAGAEKGAVAQQLLQAYAQGDTDTAYRLYFQIPSLPGTTNYATDDEGRYCWCKTTHYTANGAQQCAFSSPSWVFGEDKESSAECAKKCARFCGYMWLFVEPYRSAFGSN